MYVIQVAQRPSDKAITTIDIKRTKYKNTFNRGGLSNPEGIYKYNAIFKSDCEYEIIEMFSPACQYTNTDEFSEAGINRYPIELTKENIPIGINIELNKFKYLTLDKHSPMNIIGGTGHGKVFC